jgi:RNA polymerase sigma-70 factor (ECF subfamily)
MFLRVALRPRTSADTEVGAPPSHADFVHVYETCFDPVWRICRRLGLSESSADDAAQDTFVLAHRRWHLFEGRSSRRTWLIGIAINVARNYRRREQKPHDVLHDQELVDARPNPEERQLSRERLARLDALLDQLSDAKREVFVLVEIEGMTAPEIARLLGVELATVYSRLRTARVEMATALARARQDGGYDV